MMTDTMITKKPKRSKAVWFPVLAGVLALVSAGVMVSQRQQGLGQLAEQKSQITQLERGVTVHSQKVQETGQAGAALSVGAPSGELDTALTRMSDDRKAVEGLLGTAFNWNSNASYVSARKTLESKYGIAEDSVFLRSFLPPAPVSTEANGKQYPYVDAAGLNSSVGSFMLKMTNVDGTNYSYLVIASVNASSNDGSATASRTDVVTVTVGADGKLSSVTGWTSPSAARSSATDHSG